MAVSEAPIADVDRVTSTAMTWPDRARQLVIIDDDTYANAAETLKAIKALRAEVDATFDPIVSTAFKAHRTACDQKRKAETPLSNAERIIKDAMVAFDDERQRQRRAEMRRLEEVERVRLEDEQLALAASMELEAKLYGDDVLQQQAEELISQPVVPVVAPAPRATPAVSGISYREVWKFEVVNPAVVPRQFLVVNESAIRGVVNGLKGATNIPGVRVYKERVVSAGRG